MRSRGPVNFGIEEHSERALLERESARMGRLRPTGPPPVSQLTLGRRERINEKAEDVALINGRSDMRQRVLQMMGVAITVSGVCLAMATLNGQAPTPAQQGPAAKTSWGEPDLQG